MIVYWLLKHKGSFQYILQIYCIEIENFILLKNIYILILFAKIFFMYITLQDICKMAVIGILKIRFFLWSDAGN